MTFFRKSIEYAAGMIALGVSPDHPFVSIDQARRAAQSGPTHADLHHHARGQMRPWRGPNRLGRARGHGPQHRDAFHSFRAQRHLQRLARREAAHSYPSCEERSALFVVGGWAERSRAGGWQERCPRRWRRRAKAHHVQRCTAHLVANLGACERERHPTHEADPHHQSRPHPFSIEEHRWWLSGYRTLVRRAQSTVEYLLTLSVLSIAVAAVVLGLGSTIRSSSLSLGGSLAESLTRGEVQP